MDKSKGIRAYSVRIIILPLILLCICMDAFSQQSQYIRINQLGYMPAAPKIAVLGSKGDLPTEDFALIDAKTSKVVFTGKVKKYGAYGPFKTSARLDFTNFKSSGEYFLKCGGAVSPGFAISDTVFRGSADFILRYMRQQRSGFNPFLQDSCHTKDGYTVYGPMPDNTFVDVSGGWHDASDYLQYVTTSANATYHLLAAYRDFPGVFRDRYEANGLPGKNQRADVLDEAKWGLDWLLKMHPRPDWMFNQLADDRDHIAMRLPTKDSVDYGMGKGLGRTLYFATGKPQGLGKYKNETTGLASTAGKFAYAFALGTGFFESNSAYGIALKKGALSAYELGRKNPGVCQTAPNRAPYYYEEANWTDDMELAAASMYSLTGDAKYRKEALVYADSEKITPWLGADTMRHYQWYPFHNFGHYELAKNNTAEKQKLISWYREGIERVWQKAETNAFYRGIPFTWCSNNLTTSFAIQCSLYRKLSGDKTYEALEQACVDWLFGCNPWGTSMVYGMPTTGDYPAHPHSSLSETYHYPLDGGLVDGPVYGSIFSQLRGITLYGEDTYKEFQSDLAVYHDDAGDYSTNEPTMDGTASLIYLMASKENEASGEFKYEQGAIIRGDESKKEIALVFTGDEFADGGEKIRLTLYDYGIKASFFLTGNFYRNRAFAGLIKGLHADGNYMGSHSDKHLLYADWNKRDSLLVSKKTFMQDLQNSFGAMKKLGIQSGRYFLPPYEWYNDSISSWTKQMTANSKPMQLINYSPGTRSNADYTWPELGKQYLSSSDIYTSIINYEGKNATGLNGFILLVHIGTDPRRKDKFYTLLPGLINDLLAKQYRFVRIDELLD